MRSLFHSISIRWGLMAIIACYAVILANYGFNYILTWDAFGYYLYLPATFIYGDPFFQDQTWIDSILTTYENTVSLYQLVDLGNGMREGKYSIGIALLNLPFFFLGHLHALLTEFPADGFSKPYSWWTNIGYLFYALIGLVLLQRVLRRLSSEPVAAIALVALFLGTNLFHQVIGAAGMPHVYAFSLYAALLTLLFRGEEKPSKLNAFFTGLIMGLLVLVRPSELFAVVLIVLWKYQGGTLIRFFRESIRWRIRDYWIPFAIGLLAMGSIQILRWKLATGSFLFVGYQNPGEGFDFLQPHLLDFLFSFRKGWLLYSPMLLFALIGTTLLPKERKRWPILAFSALCIYIVSSWSNWWYADSFGNRGIVQAYAVFAIPLAAFVHWAWNQKMVWRTSMITGVVLLVFLNFFQTWQAERWVIHSSRMTQEAYASVFLKTQAPPNFEELLLLDRETVMKQPIDTTAFHISRSDHFDDHDTLTPENPFVPVYFEPYGTLSDQNHVWVEAQASIVRKELETDWPMLVFSIENRRGEYGAIYQACTPEAGSEDRDTIQVYEAFLTPHIRHPDDAVKVYFWLNGQGSAIILDRTITIRQKH